MQHLEETGVSDPVLLSGELDWVLFFSEPWCFFLEKVRMFGFDLDASKALSPNPNICSPNPGTLPLSLGCEKQAHPGSDSSAVHVF